MMTIRTYRIFLSLFLFSLLLLPLADLHGTAMSMPKAQLALLTSPTPSPAEAPRSPQPLHPEPQAGPNARLQAVREGKWPAQVAASRGDIAPDRILVKFKSGVHFLSGNKKMTDKHSVNTVLERYAVSHVAPLLPPLQDNINGPGLNQDDRRIDNIYLLSTRSKKEEDILTLVEKLNSNPLVEYAEPDYIARPITTPTDPRYNEQWGLFAIEAESFWDVTWGSPNIVVAIIDSGIDVTHPDLIPNLWVNPGEVPNNVIDDDGNGFVDDFQGWNFVSRNNDITDNNGHGTLVAGVVGARANNSLGVTGVCGDCQLMPIKVMQAAEVANYSDIAAGVIYATDKGARVINISLGGYAKSKTLYDAIAYAVAHDVVVVAGAGNDHVEAPFYPAAYDNVVSVAGVTVSDTVTSLSNFGSWIDVSAPGEVILTTAMGGGYVSASGTSFAASFASGLSGLLLSLHPDWTPALVKSHLTHTADSLDVLNPGFEGKLGGGRINARKAKVQPEPAFTIADVIVNGIPGGKPVASAAVTLTVQIHNDWADASSISGTLSTTDSLVTIISESAGFADTPSGQSTSNVTPYAFNIASAAGYNHPIPFLLQISANNTYNAAIPFTITTRSSDEIVAGTILTNTIWTHDKTYVITDNTGVAPGITLTIEAGTTVEFSGNYALNIGGTLIAKGTPQNPIIFTSRNSAQWAYINIDDFSTDAVTTPDGTYQNGTLLTNIKIDRATNGLICKGATPYLNNISVSAGGINCSAGATPLWILDSDVTGDVTIYGTLHISNSKILSGTLFVNQQAFIADSTVEKGIEIQGAGLIDNAQVYGHVYMNTGTIRNTSITNGGISLSSSGSIESTSIQNGGVSIGAASIVSDTSIEDSPGAGIRASNNATIINNRIVNSSGTGIIASSGLIQGNLVANNKGDGLQIGGGTVISNTILGTSGKTIYATGGIPMISGNNLVSNQGQYDLYNENPYGQDIAASYNWWGTTDTAIIAQHIYDLIDDYTVGRVWFDPIEQAPVSSAPAYVQQLTLNPASPVGIQKVDFNVQFNRQMDISILPDLKFQNTARGIWNSYWEGPIDIYIHDIFSIARDINGDVWFGGQSDSDIHGAMVGVLVIRHTDGTWGHINNSDFGIPDGWLNVAQALDIAIDSYGNKWIALGSWGLGLVKENGLIFRYTPANSGLTDYARTVEIDSKGNVWIGGSSGIDVLHPDGTWESFTPNNSGLSGPYVGKIVIDPSDNVWILNHDTERQYLDMLQSSGLWKHFDVKDIYAINDMVSDSKGNIWLGTAGDNARLKLLSGDTWQDIIPSINELSCSWCSWSSLFIDPDDNLWFFLAGWNPDKVRNIGVRTVDGRWYLFSSTDVLGFSYDNFYVTAILADNPYSRWFAEQGSGVAELTNGPYFNILEPQSGYWLNTNTYHASYDFSTIHPRGTYSITVSGAIGKDNIEIAPDLSYTFTLDYAGAISDDTAPLKPVVKAAVISTSVITATWTASDPDTSITLYRYAIGTTPGGTQVVNWTDIGDTNLTRSGLVLKEGQLYYVSVMARNEGGLWSAVGSSNGISMDISGPTATPTGTPTPTPTSTPTATSTPAGMWNLMSFNVQPPSTAVTEVMHSVEGKYDRILGEDGSFVTSIPAMFNTLHNMYPGEAYWVHMLQTATLTITGTLVPADTPIALHEGWNWIGYLPEASQPVTQALASIDGLYTRIIGDDGSFVVGIPPNFNTLSTLDPGKGYLLYMAAPGALTYPAGNTATLSLAPPAIQDANCTPAQNRTTLFSEVYGYITPETCGPVGATVTAHRPDGMAVGCFSFETPGTYGLMRIYRQDPNTPSIPVLPPGECVRFRIDGAPVQANGRETWCPPAESFSVEQVNLHCTTTSPATDYHTWLPLLIHQ